LNLYGTEKIKKMEKIQKNIKNQKMEKIQKNIKNQKKVIIGKKKYMIE
tara:strand:+ start:898 stop:1041 length:144 start_codon:yes stop_codon:yes gene_type:complete